MWVFSIALPFLFVDSVDLVPRDAYWIEYFNRYEIYFDMLESGNMNLKNILEQEQIESTETLSQDSLNEYHL